MTKYFILISVLLTAGGVNANQLTAGPGGILSLDQPELKLRPSLFTDSWEGRQSEYDVEKPASDSKYLFSLNPYGSNEIDGSAVFSQEDGKIKADYRFTAKTDISLNSLYIGTPLNLKRFVGGSWKTDSKSGMFPKEYKDMTLMRDMTTSCTLTTADSTLTATFTFPAKTDVMIQDSRKWSDLFELRIGHIPHTRFRKDEQTQISFTLHTTDQPPLKMQQPVTITAGNDWIPLTVKLDIESGSALDMSHQGFVDAPAGKNGWLIAKDSHFVFEKTPEKPQRFYGVNFCFSANYLEEDVADKIAERLTRIGYNSIRIHHYDAQMTSGSSDGTKLNEEEMKKFDNFTAACIRHGIYLSTDLFVSRKVPWKAVGIDKAGSIPMSTFKMMVPVHEGAYNNLKNYTINWLSHVNPHTGRSYAKEPALAWINIINEGNFGNKFSEIKDIPEWSQAWQKWLAAKKISEPQSYGSIPDTIPPDLSMVNNDPHKAAFILFMRDLEINMIGRFKKVLREELGCRALVSNSNGWTHFVPDQYVRSQTYDYVDEHFYVDHPRFIKNRWSLPSYCANKNPVKNSSSGCRPEIYIRLFDKPFTITEYNYSAPGRFRGVGGILTGALAALQDWDGLWRFAYSHNGSDVSSMQSRKLNYFDMMNDPLSLAAERASMCLFLRSDLKPLTESALVFLPEDKINSVNQVYPQTKSLWTSLGWSHKTGTLVGHTIPDGFTYKAEFPEIYRQYKEDSSVIPFIGSTTRDLIKQNKALAIDNESGTFVIITDKTCGGFTEDGAVSAGPLAFRIGGTAATVWVSSLDNQPIGNSGRMLLTHLTDIQNTNVRYAEDSRQTLLAWGTLPHLARNGYAEISLAVKDPQNFKVYALETDGHRAGEIPARIVKDRLRFDAKTDTYKDNATIVYEIVKE